MLTLDSENISFDNSSTDNILRLILKTGKTDGRIKKPLYDFNSVEHTFNVKLVRKSPLNNNSRPSNGEESSTDNSKMPTQANQETNTSSSPAVIEIMLPVKVPFKSAVSSALEELPRSNKEEIPFTPIQLVKYSRFNRSKFHNFSTPKESSKKSLFTCPISPVGKDLVKLNTQDKHKIIAQPAEKSHIKEDKHKSNQNISPDNSGYCCFHNPTRRSSNQKTITKSKYMSLGSMKNTKMMSLAFNSKTVEATMAMSLTNVTRRPPNADMFDDTSSSSGSEEISNINVETSFYLNRMLIDTNKEIVQRLYIEPSQSRVDLNESEKNQQYGITVNDNLGNFLQSPLNDNIEQNILSEESSTSRVSSIGYTKTDSINLLGNVVNLQNGNVKLVEAPLLNAPIAQCDVIATEQIGDILQQLVNNNVEHDLLTEESDSMSESIVGFSNMDESTNELDREGNLQKGPNLAKLAQNDITATEEVESIIQPPVNNNVQQNLVPVESDYSGGSIVGCTKMDISINELDHAGNLQKDFNLAKMDEVTLTNVPILECSIDITEELRRSSKENLIDKKNENEIAINQGVKNVEKPPHLTEELKNTKNIDPKSSNLSNQTLTSITESCKSTLGVTEQAEEARVNCILESLNLNSTVRSTRSLRQSTRWKKQDLISNTNQRKLSKKKEVDKNVIHREMLQRCNTTIAGKSVNADTRSSMLSSRTDLGIVQYASRVPVNHGQSKSNADCNVGVRQSSRLKTIDGSKPSSSTLVKVKLNSSVAVVKSDEQLPFMIDISHRNSRSVKSNHKSGSGQPKSTVDCPVEVRQSARISHRSSCSRNPNHKSRSGQQKSTMNCTVEVRQSARLKKLEGNANSAIYKAKRRSSKTVDKGSSEPVVKILKNSCRAQRNTPPHLNKSLADATSDEQLLCMTGPRRSSRSPKPMHAYWLCGLRPIIPVIRDIKQLADQYDSKIPIIFLPPKQLSNEAMSNLLNKINDRIVVRPAYGASMRY